jgi:nitrate/nitrite-specific signal transduction histidine kinase
MKAVSPNFEEAVLKKFDELQRTIYGFSTDIEVLATKLEERTGKKALIVSSISALMTVATVAVMMYFK